MSRRTPDQRVVTLPLLVHLAHRVPMSSRGLLGQTSTYEDGLYRAADGGGRLWDEPSQERTRDPYSASRTTASTRGASSWYITGVTIRASSVLDTRPPMITQASGEYSPLPCRAIGSRPPIAVRLVSTIGRNRTSPALRIAASRAIPSARSRLVRSTSTMDALISVPLS